MAVRRTLTLLLVSLSLVVTACGEDDPEPRVAEPTPSASPSPSEEATEAVEETPEEFIQRWNDEATALQLSGEADTYLTLSKGCEPCRGFVDAVVDIYDAGGSIETKGWRIRSVERLGRDGGRHSFRVEVDSRPTTIRDTRGETQRSLRGGQGAYEIVLSRRTSGWNVNTYYQLSS